MDGPTNVMTCYKFVGRVIDKMIYKISLESIKGISITEIWQKNPIHSLEGGVCHEKLYPSGLLPIAVIRLQFRPRKPTFQCLGHVCQQNS